MAEDAKKSVANDAAEQKGRAETEENTPEKDSEIAEAEVVEDVSADEKDKSGSDEKNDSDSSEKSDTRDSDETEDTEKDSEDSEKESESSERASKDKVEKIEIEIEASSKPREKDDFQAEVREQIENCKFEIISALQESIHNDLQQTSDKQVRRAERRRCVGFIIRDVIILLLAIIVGYFGYCLYDAKYFDFLQPDCNISNCDNNSGNAANNSVAKEVKDTSWYLRNYGYLFNGLQTNLDADKVSAHYLYSDDHKVSDIQPEYLLAIAYNHLNDGALSVDNGEVSVTAEDMRVAFINVFGDANNFAKHNFTYDCIDFKYDKGNDTFLAPNIACQSSSRRQILEQVDEIYEEGNAMYFLTTATIYDKSEQSFYTFDNLFKPAVANVSAEDLTKHSSLLNRYQYRFKRIDDKFYFSDIVKLK